MRREYNNVRVELLKIRGKYIPSAFYVEQKLYEIEEILSIRKGMVQCGMPGIRYFVKAHGQEAELLFDNSEKSWMAIVYGPTMVAGLAVKKAE